MKIIINWRLHSLPYTVILTLLLTKCMFSYKHLAKLIKKFVSKMAYYRTISHAYTITRTSQRIPTLAVVQLSPFEYVQIVCYCLTSRNRSDFIGWVWNMKENGVVCMHNCLGEQNCQLLRKGCLGFAEQNCYHSNLSFINNKLLICVCQCNAKNPEKRPIAL